MSEKKVDGAKIPGCGPTTCRPAAGARSRRWPGPWLAQETIVEGGKTLMRANQPEGFDCPGCAWPDPKHTSFVRVLRKRRQGRVVGSHGQTCHACLLRLSTTLSASLWTWSDHRAGRPEGRLTHPMAYDPARQTATCRSAGRTRSARIGAGAAARWPASGRWPSSTPPAAPRNEAAFLYQLMVRRVRHQQLPRLLQHVPRGDQRGPARVHRRGQGHGDAGRFRPLPT